MSKFIPAFFFLAGSFFALPICAQNFWAAGFTEYLDQPVNGKILIRTLPDMIIIEDFDTPVQFESTMAGALDENGEIIFYTNGCHIYDRNHQIVPGGEGLNPGAVHDLACDDYGYLAPKGASVVTFKTHPNLYFLIHVGISEEIAHSVAYGPLYLTRIFYDPDTQAVTILSKNEILLDEEIDPFELIRHGNGNDWWLLTNSFGTADFHKLLLTPEGVQEVAIQSVGYEFPFPPCRWQRSLSASPSGERLVRFSSKCGAQYLTFDRCSGELAEAGFSHLENGIFGGGGSVFSKDSRFVYFSRWYRVIKVFFETPPDTLRASFVPPAGFGGSFVHFYRDPYSRIYVGPQAAEPYLHQIRPEDSQPDTALVQFESLPLPKRIQRTIPHYPNLELGPLQDSPCDTLLSSTTVLAQNPVDIRVFPNPANAFVTLAIDYIGKKQVYLLDAIGQKVQSWNTTAEKLDIELSQYDAGMYFILVLLDNGNWQTVRFVKMK